jgi:hypothetical protein
MDETREDTSGCVYCDAGVESEEIGGTRIHIIDDDVNGHARWLCTRRVEPQPVPISR